MPSPRNGTASGLPILAENPYPNVIGHYHGLGIGALSAVMSVHKPAAAKPDPWRTTEPQWPNIGDWLKG